MSARRLGLLSIAARVAAIWGALALVVMLASSLAFWWVPPTVNLVRALPFVGFGRMQWLEQQALSALDALERIGSSPPAGPMKLPAPPSESSRALWPPGPLLPLLDEVEGGAGEGQWGPLRGCEEPLEPDAIVMTTLRVDASRPDVRTWIVAMDTRALDLELVPGLSAGQGAWGEPRSGAVIAAFNGGFQSEHGDFGMASGAARWVPLSTNLATLVRREDGSLWMGAWTATSARDGDLWVRQNLQVLQRGERVYEGLYVVDSGERFPIGHTPTRRSGICARAPHTLFYVWSPRATSYSLGLAMVALGCDVGMHLDLNAFHTGFETWTRTSEGRCAHKLTPRMSDIPQGRFVDPSSRDFFAIVPRPKVVEAPLAVESRPEAKEPVVPPR